MATYRVVTDWAGARNGRASSLYSLFADANRRAMAEAAAQGKEMRVYDDEGQFIVSYNRGASGLACLVAVGS